MKKLRTGVRIHAETSVHGSEVTSKLEAGITVVTSQPELLFDRYDVYYVKLRDFEYRVFDPICTSIGSAPNCQASRLVYPVHGVAATANAS